MKVLVTGVGGFIGSRVAARFVDDGHEVVGVDDFSTGKMSNVPCKVKLIEGDLANTKTLRELPTDCRCILHLAGQSSGEISFDNPVEDIHKNTVSTLNLIQFGIEHGAQKFVYASSMSVYGDVPDIPAREESVCQPLSCYGVGKLAAEGYLRVYGHRMPYVIMRMFNVYGPGQNMDNLRQGMVSIYLSQALATGRVHVKGSLERFRDFAYIDDVVDAWWQAVFCPEAANLAINVATGKRTTVRALLEAIRKCVPEMSWYVEGSTPGDQSGIYAEISRMRNILGLTSFTSLEEGLRRFVDWARAAMPAQKRTTRVE